MCPESWDLPRRRMVGSPKPRKLPLRRGQLRQNRWARRHSRLSSRRGSARALWPESLHIPRRRLVGSPKQRTVPLRQLRRGRWARRRRRPPSEPPGPPGGPLHRRRCRRHRGGVDQWYGGQQAWTCATAAAHGRTKKATPGIGSTGDIEMRTTDLCTRWVTALIRGVLSHLRLGMIGPKMFPLLRRRCPLTAAPPSLVMLQSMPWPSTAPEHAFADDDAY